MRVPPLSALRPLGRGNIGSMGAEVQDFRDGLLPARSFFRRHQFAACSLATLTADGFFLAKEAHEMPFLAVALFTGAVSVAVYALAHSTLDKVRRLLVPTALTVELSDPPTSVDLARFAELNARLRDEIGRYFGNKSLVDKLSTADSFFDANPGISGYWTSQTREIALPRHLCRSLLHGNGIDKLGAFYDLVHEHIHAASDIKRDNHSGITSVWSEGLTELSAMQTVGHFAHRVGVDVDTRLLPQLNHGFYDGFNRGVAIVLRECSSLTGIPSRALVRQLVHLGCGRASLEWLCEQVVDTMVTNTQSRQELVSELVDNIETGCTFLRDGSSSSTTGQMAAQLAVGQMRRMLEGAGASLPPATDPKQAYESVIDLKLAPNADALVV